MRYLPIELDVRDREALVIGAGAEVVSKVDRLVAAGAKVTLIAPDAIGAELEERAQSGAITWLRRAFEEADLEGKAIVFQAPFATPDDEALARRLHAEAARRGTLFCAIDRPEACTFVNAAVVSASGLTMTISTGGASPGLARRLREDLAALFGDARFGRFLGALRSMREALPRGERAAKMAKAVEGFAIEARLRYPAWFEPGDDADPR